MKLGIIGGSGLDDPSLLNGATDHSVDTPWGDPSSPIRSGNLHGLEVCFLSRHGREHTLPPSFINNRANLHALHELGCDAVIATAACGSLRPEMDRGHLVIPDQFIDFTRRRDVTFFESFDPGIQNARHVPMGDPFDPQLRKLLIGAASEVNAHHHSEGTLLTIEGNRFSTRAESRMFQAWGADLVNMTVAPEVILANELGLPYAAIAVVTDFDSWKTDEPPLQVEDLIRVFHDNVSTVQSVLLKAMERLRDGQENKPRCL